MGSKKSLIFIVTSSIALMLVLSIQIMWIQQAAANKEELFDEKAGIVIARTTEDLSKDSVLSSKLQTSTSREDSLKIIGLLNKHMRYYNFRPAYSFEIHRSSAYGAPDTYAKPAADTVINEAATACNVISADSLARINGWKIKLNFPDKEKMLMSEMRLPFIISAILICIVLILFWRTVSSLIKEKKISEHTTDFLNNMTHEFKTPLTNIALAGKMIVKDAAQKEEEEKTKHYSEIILEENEKLRLQVEHVLSMTALERGEIPIRKTELEVHQVIESAAKVIGLQVENRKGQLHLKLSAERSVVEADKTHLTNAITNLIENALKYSGEKPEITISTFNKGPLFVMRVADKGIGIDKQFQKKVFEKYFRVPTGNVHNTKGFGLGLAYVKKIIELHGGTVELESELGKGTTFSISITNA